ncbi:hypothetical protein [Clostridium sp.]|uniref:hypothetical protein n=1 Tax=Clostridium sp. TaxID=1506 RepID=UPI001A3CEF22|nr:hypothetical protein [Clostridium sp.]MBK5240241.1 hypothetical protein [Clostridium sp.]
MASVIMKIIASYFVYKTMFKNLKDISFTLLTSNIGGYTFNVGNLGIYSENFYLNIASDKEISLL